MCDKKFVSYEALKEKTGSPTLNKFIDDKLIAKGFFDYSDYKEYIEGKEYKEIKKVRKNISIYVGSHLNVKMVGDLTFKSPTFRIIYKKNTKNKSK